MCHTQLGIKRYFSKLGLASLAASMTSLLIDSFFLCPWLVNTITTIVLPLLCEGANRVSLSSGVLGVIREEVRDI